MPFTPAHTAILFPARWINPAYISWTALIIGSMVPDAEYFIWLNSGSYLSHTLWGILVFNIPLTFLLAIAWHSFIRKGLVQKIPFIKNKYSKNYILDFPILLKKNFIVFSISAIIGITSHLFWDSFCHAKGFMVHRIPYLIDYLSVYGHQIRWCYVCWYLSTVIGLIIISIIMIDRKALFNTKQWGLLLNEKFFWGKVILIAAIIAVLRISLGLNQNIPRHLIIITIGSFLYGIVISTFLIRKR